MSFGGLLRRDAWKSFDYKESTMAVRKITNQKRLAQIATEAPHLETCVLAIEKLNKKYQELFADIALSDRDRPNDMLVREAAVKKLTDQRLLSKVIAKYNNDFFWKIRQLAVKNLTSQSLLAEIAKNDRDYGVRKTAIENKYFTDQNDLADIAKNKTEYTELRFKAIEKLTDKILAQKIYADIAENNSYYIRRIEAAEKLTDQTLAQKVYIDVVKNPPTPPHFEFDYQTAISRFWWEYEYYAKRLFAKMTDQNTLLDIAKNGKYKPFCKAAIEQLFDQELLVDVAKHAELYAVRIMAAEKLTDKTIAEEVFLNVVSKSDSELDCKKAIMNINDQRALAKIAKSVTFGVEKYFKGENDYSEDDRMARGYGYLREMAIKKLTDREVLTEISNGDEECVYNVSINHIYYVDSDHHYCPIEYMLPVPHDNWVNHTLDVRETARKRMLEWENLVR